MGEMARPFAFARLARVRACSPIFPLPLAPFSMPCAYHVSLCACACTSQFVTMTTKLGQRLPIADHFRRCHAYTADVDATLRKYETSLRNIYNGLVDAGRVTGHVTFGSWTGFLNAAGLVNLDVSEREGILCFVWSRMVVFDGQTYSGRVKESCLPFEGYARVAITAARAISPLISLPVLQVVAASPQPGGWVALWFM